MEKVKSLVVVVSLMFIVALAAVGCAQTGADIIGISTKSMSGDTMDSSMDKAMDTMDKEKMDGSMEKDMQNGMK